MPFGTIPQGSGERFDTAGNLEHRVRMLEAAFLNERNAGPPPSWRVAKYSDEQVDALLRKWGKLSLAWAGSTNR